MKIVVCFLVISTTVLLACSKSGSDSYPYGKWRLVQQDWQFGPNAGVRVPGADSSVTLILSRDKTYATTLNGNIVSQGSFTITTDKYNTHQQLLQLNDFKITGIFSTYRISEVETSGQLLSLVDGLFMNISNDTMKFSGSLNPGGNTSYTFVRG